MVEPTTESRFLRGCEDINDRFSTGLVWGPVEYRARAICKRVDNGKRIFDVLSSLYSFFPRAFDAIDSCSLPGPTCQERTPRPGV